MTRLFPDRPLDENGQRKQFVSSILPPAKEEDWTLDPTGNWTGYLTKTTGTTDLDQSRGHNKANEIDTDNNHANSPGNPLDNLHSNWAYRVMSSLAWTLKSWCGLLLPARPGPWKSRHREQKRSLVRMEFKGFLNAMMRLPCQIVRTGRRIVYRLMSWNPWTGCLLRLAAALRRPLRC